MEQTDEIADFLASHPAPIAAHAHRLRHLVAQAAPSGVERLRPGWTRDAARIAAMSRGERQLLALKKSA